jgi:hypothetical protein
MIKHTVLAVVAVFVFARQAGAQAFLPISPDDKPALRIPLKAADLRAVQLLADRYTLMADAVPSVAPAAASVLPKCDAPPQLADISGTFKYNQTLLTTAAALKLGVGPLGLGGSGSQQLVVREWNRVEPCVATDGKTVVLYGQSIRTVIAVATVDAKADLSLAALAANATLSRRSAQVSIEAIGLSNPKMDLAVATLAAKELTVETYADFAKVQGTLLELLNDGDTKTSVKRVGIRSEATEQDLLEAVATAYGLYQLKNGVSCQQAKAQFPKAADAGATAAIEGVYSKLGLSCDATARGKIEKLRAEQLLVGIQVKGPL